MKKQQLIEIMRVFELQGFKIEKVSSFTFQSFDFVNVGKFGINQGLKIDFKHNKIYWEVRR